MLVSSWGGGGYLEPQLLTRITALESLEGAIGGRRKMPKEEFAALKQALLDTAGPEHQDWINGALRNDLSLQERLMHLADLLPAGVAARLLPSVTTWARATVRTRNDLSHRGNASLGHEALFALGQIASAVAYILILRELGISDEKLAGRLTYDGELAHTCDLAAEHFAEHSAPAAPQR
jgi:hypothetical protein